MTKITGKLVKQGNRFMVNLPSKNGSANHSIPELAKQFADADATDGLEVDVVKDPANPNRILSVTIPGKPIVQAKVTPPPRRAKSGREQSRGKAHSGATGFGKQQTSRGKMQKAPAKVLGRSFHNPYTFIPFPNVQPKRQAPTLRSADETQNSARYSGVLRLRVTTLSPLLSCKPEPRDEKCEHKEYDALTIGNDVIVPSTGIRGALRTLLTIVTGGTLGYLNTNEILCQGRDVNMGPKGNNSPEGTPDRVHMAEVIEAGTSRRSGKVRVGRVTLVSVEELERKYHNLNEHRKPNSSHLWVELDNQDKVLRVSTTCTSNTAGRLRLSGRPVNSKGKREAVFFPTAIEMELPAIFWAEYGERHKHGDRPTLKTGDLVWLMPTDPKATSLSSEKDVASIQWARWGRKGQKLKEVVAQHHKNVLPDCMRSDGTVDTVTDLFGQIPHERGSNAPSFATRIMPENLVFFDAKSKVMQVALAPLAQPHPGCLAFYRQSSDPDSVSSDDPLRGYKVYRTTDATGDDAPWLFENQGIYEDNGKLKDRRTKLNKTCELLPLGQSGQLTLSFIALSKYELALLLQACALTWRLGGGKPLGLGRCVVAITDLIDECGQPLRIDGWKFESQPDGTYIIRGWEDEVQNFANRVSLWEASQQPVPLLRYPRAVVDTNYKKSRGGHVWFARNAQPRSGERDGKKVPGLNPVYIDGPLLETVQANGASFDSSEPMITAQSLPTLDPNNLHADALFGYDLYATRVETRQRPTRRVYLALEPFNESQHVSGNEKSSGNHGKNKDFRDRNRKRDNGHED